MMKQIATIILVAVCTFSTLADKVPSELKNLQAIRAKKIKAIDNAYIQALEKLKVKFTKRGDLESANTIVAEIKKIGTDGPLTEAGSQKHSVGSHPNNSIKKISDEWETCKVSEGTIVAVPLKTTLTYEQCVQKAELYGATLYCPMKSRDAKRMLDFLPPADPAASEENNSWMGGVKCRLKNKILELYSFDGEEYDYKKILGATLYISGPLRRRPDGTEGNVKIRVNSNGDRSFCARAQGESVNHLILLISDDH